MTKKKKVIIHKRCDKTKDPTKSLCGLFNLVNNAVDDWEEVTCLHCLRAQLDEEPSEEETTPMGMFRGESTKFYVDRKYTEDPVTIDDLPHGCWFDYNGILFIALDFDSKLTDIVNRECVRISPKPQVCKMPIHTQVKRLSKVTIIPEYK